MQKLLSRLTILFLIVSIAGCKIYTMGGENGKQISIVQRDYEIKGTVRVEGKVGKNEATYDGLLKTAREKYGQDVDVINIKVDRAKREKDEWIIMNGYAVKYAAK